MFAPKAQPRRGACVNARVHTTPGSSRGGRAQRRLDSWGQGLNAVLKMVRFAALVTASRENYESRESGT